MKPLNVAVIGAGYWGSNLIRNFARCPRTHLAAVCDQDPERLRKTLAGYSDTRACTSLNQVLDDPSIEAVAIATPVRTHAKLAEAALLADKHVLVEKPMTDNAFDAHHLIRLANKRQRTLMVDHTFLYNPAVQRIKQYIDSGELGDIYYVDSVRINIGLIQHDVNVVWDLAPHDLSIVDYLLGRTPSTISAIGTCRTSPTGLAEIAYVTMDLGDGILAAFHFNWLSPVKVRRFIIGGSKKSIVFDDLEPTAKLRLYDKGVDVKNDPASRERLLISYRTGDVLIPHIDPVEPLQVMVNHFAECAQTGKTPISDGLAGARIVEILEASQQSIDGAGRQISMPVRLRAAA